MPHTGKKSIKLLLIWLFYGEVDNAAIRINLRASAVQWDPVWPDWISGGPSQMSAICRYKERRKEGALNMFWFCGPSALCNTHSVRCLPH